MNRMMMRLARHTRHLCMLRPVAMAVVMVLTVTHPLFHNFEGGTLDAMLVYLDHWALMFSSVPVDEG